MADSLNPEHINDLIQQIKDQCSDLDSLVSHINKRLEGELQAHEALVGQQAYQEKIQRFTEAGRYHPLLETVIQQHKSLTLTAQSYLKHSLSDQPKKTSPKAGT